MLLALAMLACGPKPAPPAFVDPELPLDAVVPVDPKVRQGTLPNGLRWMVQENTRPEGRAELRLVVKVGSLAEDDDQLGLAHFLEHMAFNGTERYPGRALIDTIEGFGMEFGPHLNAYTSFEETVYQLQVPTDDPETVREALRILRDQGGSVLLEAEEIEKERGVVLGEWRQGKGPGERIYLELLGAERAGSRYPERDVIGTEASLRGFDPAALRRFYTDWYRPDLMAVLVVGDLPADWVVDQIEQSFGDLSGPSNPRALPSNAIPPHPPRIQVVTDPAADGTAWMLSDQRDLRAGPTYGDYRKWVQDQVVMALLDRRLRDISREPDSPVLYATSYLDRLNPGEVQDMLYADAVSGRELEALERVALEARRIRVHGFSETDLALARESVAQSYEELYESRGTEDSTEEIEELVRHFTQDEIMPGTEKEVELARRWLPTFTVAELNAVAARWLEQGSELVQLVMPAEDGAATPSEAEIRAVLDRARVARVKPLPETRTVDQLMEPPAAELAATVLSRRHDEVLELDVLQLSNGIELYLKPTDFEDDVVVLHALSPGGTSHVVDEELDAARMARGIAGYSGLGALDAPEFWDLMERHRIEGSTSLGDADEGLWASGSSSELEFLLQWTSLQLTAPRLTEEGLELYGRNLVESIQGWERSVEYPFEVARHEAVWGKDPRARLWSTDIMERASLEVSRRVLQERFQNAADFRWFLVGDFDAAEVEPLLLRYLGALPVSEDRETVGPHREQLRWEDVSTVVYSGTEPKADVERTWLRPFPEPSWLRRNQVHALLSVLQLRAERTMREELGGVYGVSVSGGSATWPEDHLNVSVSFTCAPERVDELLAALDAEVQALLAEPPSEEEVALQRKQKARSRETTVKTNRFWPSAVLGALVRGEDPHELMRYQDRLDQLTPEALHATAQEVFGGEGAELQVIRLPESHRPATEE